MLYSIKLGYMEFKPKPDPMQPMDRPSLCYMASNLVIWDPFGSQILPFPYSFQFGIWFEYLIKPFLQVTHLDLVKPGGFVRDHSTGCVCDFWEKWVVL